MWVHTVSSTPPCSDLDACFQNAIRVMVKTPLKSKKRGRAPRGLDAEGFQHVGRVAKKPGQWKADLTSSWPQWRDIFDAVISTREEMENLCVLKCKACGEEFGITNPSQARSQHIAEGKCSKPDLLEELLGRKPRRPSQGSGAGSSSPATRLRSPPGPSRSPIHITTASPSHNRHTVVATGLTR